MCWSYLWNFSAHLSHTHTHTTLTPLDPTIPPAIESTHIYAHLYTSLTPPFLYVCVIEMGVVRALASSPLTVQSISHILYTLPQRTQANHPSPPLHQPHTKTHTFKPFVLFLPPFSPSHSVSCVRVGRPSGRLPLLPHPSSRPRLASKGIQKDSAGPCQVLGASSGCDSCRGASCSDRVCWVSPCAAEAR